MGHPLTDDLGFLLSRASGVAVRATNAALTGYGLRVRQYSVLVLACDAADGLGQRDLADVLGLDPSQVVLLVDELASLGLVERVPGADRRTRLVTATPAGHEVRAGAERAASAALDDVLAGLDPTDRSHLRRVLAVVVARPASAQR